MNSKTTAILNTCHCIKQYKMLSLGPYIIG